MKYGEVRGTAEDLAEFDEEPVDAPCVARQPRRVCLEPDKVEQGLVQLVLTVVELLRQLMQKQALRRIEAGSLAPEQVERLGDTLMRLEAQMEVLKTHFGIKDLNMDLGPLGNLVD